MKTAQSMTSQQLKHLSSVLLLVCTVRFVTSEVYHLTSSQSDSNSCNTEHHLTFSQFARNSSNYLTTDMRLIFAPGNYTLESELIIKDIHSFTMFSSESTSPSKTVIFCSYHARFDFSNVSVVTMSGFDFIGCIRNKVVSVSQFQLEHSRFICEAGTSGTALIVTESTATLDRVAFLFNVGSEQRMISQAANYVTETAGGAVLSNRSVIIIIQSWFEGNSAGVGGAIYSELNSNITILSTTFVENRATAYCRVCGGGVLYADSRSTVKVRDSKFERNMAKSDGGVFLIQQNTNHVIHNQFSTEYGTVSHSTSDLVSIITTHNSEFISNCARRGAVAAVTAGDMTIAHSKFINNSVSNNMIYTINGTNLNISHSTFINNRAAVTVIALYTNMISISHSAFINNTEVVVRYANMISISHSKFVDNYAMYVYVLSGVNMISISHSAFVDNVGNVLSIDGGNISISHSAFVDNVGNIATIFSGNIISISHSTFVDNVRRVLSILYGNIISISHNEFINNQVEDIDGVVAIYFSENVTVANNEFIKNSALYDVYIGSFCKPGFALSLGSSRCIECSSNWLQNLIGIVIAALVAGIALIIIVLALNMTIAVGTLNGILFYTNIVMVNADTYLPFSTPNIATVFISWFNLDIGFDVCFFEGLDRSDKALIRLAFPAYVIILVIIIIVISECSSKFAKLIGKGNPVAALTTMILFSYTKFFNTISESVSLLYLQTSYGSRNLDVAKLRGQINIEKKNIPLLVFIPIILLMGILYAALIFSWQWLLCYQNKALFKWVRYQKLQHFIEPHYAPYTSKFRYWTGLLLLVRVLLILVFSLNFAGNPKQDLVSTFFVVSCLILVKGVTARRIYTSWLVDVMETIMFFNLVAFAAFTWYTLESGGNKTAVAYTSIMITFIIFLAVIAFHALRYTRLYNCPLVQKTFEQISTKLSENEPKQETPADVPEELDGYLLDRVQEPTHSVVDLHKPLLRES